MPNPKPLPSQPSCPKRSHSAPVQPSPNAPIKSSCPTFDNSLSRTDDLQAALKQKILNSFQYRHEQSVSEIHQQTRGDFDDFHEALQQLEANDEIVCVNVRPNRYRLVKVPDSVLKQFCFTHQTSNEWTSI